MAADLLDAAGKHDAAVVCRTAASSPQRLEFQPDVIAAMQQLGPDYMRLFTFDETTRARYTELTKAEPGLDWTRGLSHLPLVADMYRDRTAELGRLRGPSMLVHGVADLVTPPAVIDTYRSRTDGSVVTIDQAAHFAFVEQPDDYVRAVASFVTQAANAANTTS